MIRTTRNKAARRGATIVELAITLSLFVTLVLGMIDLGYGIFRYHILAQASRQLARHAVVHGNLAARLGPWGPQSVQITADSESALAEPIRGSLVGWQLSEVQLELQWPDGGNEGELGHRVSVTISAPYEPMLTFMVGSPAMILTASSTMRIAH